MPAAPAWTQSSALLAVMPPRASTGMLTARDRLRETFDSSRFEAGSFRARREHRTEDGIVGALVLCGADLVESVAGDSDQKSRRGEGAPDAGGGRSGGQVSPGGPGGQCHVDARVYQNFRSVRIRKTKNLPCEIEQIPPRKILLADLNPFNAGTKIPGDVAKLSNAGRQTVTIGNVAAKHALSV